MQLFSSRSRPCIEYQMNRCSAPCVGNISKNYYEEDLIEAKNFLSFSNSHNEKRLKREIDKYAKTFNYEKAAEIRDKLKRIKIINEEQSISTRAQDIDIFFVKRDNGYIGICIVAVRRGKIRGTKTHLIKGRYFDNFNKVYESAIFNFYTNNNDIPRKVLTGHLISSSKVIENAIYIKSNIKVKIISTPNKEIRPIFNLCKSNANQIIVNHLSKEHKFSFAINELQAILNIKEINRIESYDISHFSQDSGVAACVVYDRNGSSKKDYRLFNIPKDIAGNDIGSLEHAIKRRLKYYDKKSIKPDLLLIDGGKSQLKFTEKIIRNSEHRDITIISIVKGTGRIRATETILSKNGIVEMDKNSKAFLLLQEIRDEAHRFAINSQRKKKQKNITKSILDEIYGVGPKTKSRLIKKYKNLKAIKEANVHDLMTIKGINEKIALKIKHFIK